MAKLGEHDLVRDDLFHLAKVALSGRPHDLQILVRKLARQYRGTDQELATDLMALLRKAPSQSASTRRAESAGLPLDSDSSLPLLRLIEVPVLESEPVYDDRRWGQLQQLVQEQSGSDRLREAGIDPTRTVLFTGPPGVGKTLAAKWVARELGRPLATLDLSAVMSSFLGRTGNNVRVVLDYAREHDCVLLLDELDAVAKRRDDATEIGELKRLVTVLLQEIDEWPATGLLLAATNHPDLLDPAVWRRFESVIDFPLPEREHLAAVCSDMLGDQVDKAWSTALGIAMEGNSYSDAVRQIRRALRAAALNGGGIEEGLFRLVNDVSEALDRNDRQELAIVLMHDAGLSQRQASDLTGVSRDTIRKRGRQAKEV